LIEGKIVPAVLLHHGAK